MADVMEKVINDMMDDMMDAFRHLGIEKKNLSGYKAMGEAGNGVIYSTIV